LEPQDASLSVFLSAQKDILEPDQALVAISRIFGKWDQSTNTWTQKADFGGSARGWAVGFSIGTKGYIGTGADNLNGDLKDFWEWNQSTNVWSQKADFGGTGRNAAVGFPLAVKVI